MQFKFKPIAKLSLLLIIPLSLFACGGGGGGGGSATVPKNPDGSATVVFNTLGWNPQAVFWSCKTQVNVGGKSISYITPTTNGAPIKLSEGEYTASIDVSCYCESTWGCSTSSNGTWNPGFTVTDIYGKVIAQRPEKTYGGFSLLVDLVVKDGAVSGGSNAARSGEAPRISQVASTFNSTNSETMLIEFEVLSDMDKTADAMVQALTCDIDYNMAWHGGFGFHNVKVKNVSNEVVPSWGVNLYFSEGVPTAEWHWGADSVTRNANNSLLVKGSQELSPGEELTFGVGGTYQGGSNQIGVECR